MLREIFGGFLIKVTKELKFITDDKVVTAHLAAVTK